MPHAHRRNADGVTLKGDATSWEDVHLATTIRCCTESEASGPPHPRIHRARAVSHPILYYLSPYSLLPLTMFTLLPPLPLFTLQLPLWLPECACTDTFINLRDQ